MGFRLGLIDKDSRWLAMVEDRNRTAHTYDETTARAIYRALPEYGKLMRQLLARMKEGEQRRAREGD